MKNAPADQRLHGDDRAESVGARNRFVPIIASTLAFIAVNTGLRTWSALMSLPSERESFGIVWSAGSGLVNSYIDVSILVACAALTALGVQNLPDRTGRFLVSLFFSFSFFCILLSWVNALALAFLGRSLTYQWLYYADLFRSFTSRSSISPVVTQGAIVTLSGAALMWLTIYFVALRALSRHQLHGSRRAGSALFAALGLYLTIAHNLSPRYAVTESQATNPLVELISTAVTAWRGGLLEHEDAIPPESLPPPSRDAALLPTGLQETKIRNVLLVVMESVGAKYVAGEGGRVSATYTPLLAEHARHGISFQNFYSHVPMSTKSLYSLVTGRYPVFSFETETTIFADRPVKTISDILREKGRRTAFFMSGDLEFQNVESLVERNGFETLADMRTIPCSRPVHRGSSNAWQNLDALDDQCTADHAWNWIKNDPQADFFAVFWTGNTHFPYFARPDERVPPLDPDPRKSRYLAALRNSDAAIGTLLARLKESGRLDDTLVVVTGDHGEAFGEHGERVHGTSIFDEQVRVPLLLIHPSIKGPIVKDTLGGMIDVAPTILHLLGSDAKLDEHGRSLFDPERAQRVFMFAPNQGMVAGFREADRKSVFNLSRGTTAVYDLQADPGETINIGDAETAKLTRRKLAGWVKHQAADPRQSR